MKVWMFKLSHIVAAIALVLLYYSKKPSPVRKGRSDPSSKQF